METITTSSGHVRLRIQTKGRWVYIGPFLNLCGARRFAQDLLRGHGVTALRVEHRQRGTWRPAWSWLSGALLVFALTVALTGCAGRGEVRSTVWLSLTPSERAEADRLERAIEKLRADCFTLFGVVCARYVPSVVVSGKGTRPHYQNGYGIIVIPRFLLVDNPVTHAVLAHELAHAWFSDARDDCRSEETAFLCEQAANRLGVSVLIDGYGYSYGEAMLAMWQKLVTILSQNPKPAWGHPDACAELHAFELWARVPTYNCREK